MIKKLVSKKIWKEIKKAKSILLTIHPSPDADSVGSNLALYEVISKMGKKVTLIAGDSEFPQNMATLPNSNKVLPKNFFQINQNDYDLFIIADISDKKRISNQGEVKLSKHLKTICIDHHFSNQKFANINLIDVKSPATCQLIYEFLQVNKIKITKNIANCLFIGIYADTGGFKYLNTTHKTFLIVSDLVKIYPKFNKTVFELENNDKADRLKFLSLMFAAIKTYCSEKVAISSIDFKTIQENNLDNSSVIHGSDIANSIKSVTGWEIGISLIEVQPNLIKISFRTRDPNKYDLTKVAAALGGGGHKPAAGAVLNNMSLQKGIDLIIEKLQKVYPDLRK
ncbi:MAG: bifunctional oligoribonuclease/PAP phosphatase NrnA [Candidatus Shapirobacteria bacterium]